MVKKFSIAIAILFALCSPGFCNLEPTKKPAEQPWYSLDKLQDDFMADTEEIFFKNVKTAFFYDWLEENSEDRKKFGVSSPMLAWKFLSVEPIFIYTPNRANQVGEGGLSFPIRLGRIPTGDGYVLSDYGTARPDGVGKIIDKLYMGIYASQNLSTGRFGFGYTIGLIW